MIGKVRGLGSFCLQSTPCVQHRQSLLGRVTEGCFLPHDIHIFEDESLGGVYAQGGEIVSQIRRDTGARIKIEEALPSCTERIISISGPTRSGLPHFSFQALEGLNGQSKRRTSWNRRLISSLGHLYTWPLPLYCVLCPHEIIEHISINNRMYPHA